MALPVMLLQLIQYVPEVQAGNGLNSLLARLVSCRPQARIAMEGDCYLRVSLTESHAPYDLIHYGAVSHGRFASRHIVVTALGRTARTGAHHATASTQ